MEAVGVSHGGDAGMRQKVGDEDAPAMQSMMALKARQEIDTAKD